jgi:hypothetical protein
MTDHRAMISSAINPSHPRAGATDDLAGLGAVAAGGDRLDGVEVGLGRGLDEVGRRGAAAEGAVVALPSLP